MVFSRCFLQKQYMLWLGFEYALVKGDEALEGMTGVWLAVTILAAVAEALVPALVSIWFVPGGLAALIASLAGGPVWLQAVLFLGLSVLALVFTRPLARRLQKDGPTSTNADRVLDGVGVVTQEVDNLLGTGRVSIMGNSWAARSAAPEGKIAENTRVRVERIEGVKLIVSPETAEREGKEQA